MLCCAEVVPAFEVAVVVRSMLVVVFPLMVRVVVPRLMVIGVPSVRCSWMSLVMTPFTTVVMSTDDSLVPLCMVPLSVTVLSPVFACTEIVFTTFDSADAVEGEKRVVYPTAKSSKNDMYECVATDVSCRSYVSRGMRLMVCVSAFGITRDVMRLQHLCCCSIV